MEKTERYASAEGGKMINNRVHEFLGSIGLMERKSVKGSIPTILSNTMNPKNTMNKATKFVR
jgi:hypothetical protein